MSISENKMIRLTNEHLDELIKKTRLRGAGIYAARLHFVEGIENLAECGRLSGISKTVVSRVVRRINKAMHDKGDLITVCYTIPPQIKLSLDEYVRSLIEATIT